jgi:hypothetical protein
VKFRGLRWRFAALIAFLMGLPFVAQAKADSTSDIINGALGLTGGIIDAAGNS